MALSVPIHLAAAQSTGNGVPAIAGYFTPTHGAQLFALVVQEHSTLATSAPTVGDDLGGSWVLAGSLTSGTGPQLRAGVYRQARAPYGSLQVTATGAVNESTSVSVLEISGSDGTVVQVKSAPSATGDPAVSLDALPAVTSTVLAFYGGRGAAVADAPANYTVLHSDIITARQRFAAYYDASSAGTLAAWATSNAQSVGLLVEIAAQPAAVPLPAGNNGLAGGYPGDVGLAADPAVIFYDDFEGYNNIDGLWSNYDNFYQQSNTRIATEAVNVFAGLKALELTEPITAVPIYNAVTKNLTGYDTIFVRCYLKLDLSAAAGPAAHNGITITGNYSGPGFAPDGTDFFVVGIENTVFRGEAHPGYTHAYVYHPEQRQGFGDHWYSDGLVVAGETQGNFGGNFVPIAPRFPPMLQWYSLELMVRLNTPGVRDGRVAAWIDGVLIADWGNLRFRDVATLKIDRAEIDLGAPENTVVDHIWFDNLVISSQYIGPLFQLGSFAGVGNLSSPYSQRQWMATAKAQLGGDAVFWDVGNIMNARSRLKFMKRVKEILELDYRGNLMNAHNRRKFMMQAQALLDS